MPLPATGERQAMVERFDQITAVEGAAKAVPLPGIISALRDLHSQGYRLGVATNDSTAGAERTLAALGISQLFDAAYGYDAVANPKPAADPVIAFCDLTGLKPSEVAMVGDNNHDLEMAHNAACGLAVGVLSGTGQREALTKRADVVLGSVAELPGYLASL
jgi:phosphoglycolate phosphatase